MELPSVALRSAGPSALIVPAVAVKLAVELPASTVTEPGTAIKELSLASKIVVFDVTA